MILFVDDELESNLSYRDFLTGYGASHDIKAVSTLEEANKNLEDKKVDVELIVLDIMMPFREATASYEYYPSTSGGFNFYANILSNFEKIPVLVFSDIDSPAIQHKITQDPLTLFASKRSKQPFDKLVTKIEEILVKINKLERESIRFKHDLNILEKIASDIEKWNFVYYRKSTHSPRSENAFWAAINWLGENGEFQDAELLLSVKRNIPYRDKEDYFRKLLNMAIKKIFERSMKSFGDTPQSIHKVSTSRKQEIINEIKCLSQEVFDDRELANTWLYTSLHVLNSRAPINFLDTEKGAEKIKYILTCIDNGVIP